ncbi:glycosyltransferase family protein [Aurantiacibacter flavus]|uniref:Glycosyltransferase n=1 Tax=Aurantiacibacter flavus TaxID=3145232 RepID=A0ABV0CZ25_9SPHN
MTLRDHVAESYFGKIGDRKSTEKTRNRLYWMASQIAASDILDVGCSEGVLSILAAREGYNVTGIDLDAGAIEYAKKFAAQEMKEVRERIDFKLVDLASVADGKPAYNTVFVGEVIEHLLAPARLIELCASVLHPNGKLVITTPFGISSNWDHKQTFFPSDLVELSKGLLSIEHLSVDDGYIRYVARKAAEETEFPVGRLLAITEAGTFAAQNAAQEIMDERRKRIGRSQREIDKLKKNLETARKAQDRLEERAADLSATIVQLKSELSMEQAKYEGAEDAKREALQIAEKFEGMLEAAEKNNKLLRASLDEAKASEVEARERIKALEEQVASETKLLEQIENQAGVLRKSLKASNKNDKAKVKAKSTPAKTVPVIVEAAAPKPDPGSDALRLLTLLDEFSEKALEHDAHITRLSLKDWKDQIESGEFDAFFAESVWRGNGGEWSYAMSNPASERHATLKAVIEVCRKRGLPTIIWNKEDPPNFDVFKDSAILFDHIFTSDAGCVEKYKQLVGHGNVYALPFFAQPKLHNPIGKKEEKDKQVVFAGSWYAQKHQDRSALAPMLFDAASEHKFTIFNRHSEETKDAEKYRFPDKYQKFLKPKVSYDEMLGIHKNFQVFLSVNSVTQSDTMFARRIFEVLACSTPIVSTASSGLEKMFGDIVPVVHEPEQAREALSRLLEDSNYRHRVGHRGYRRVMTEHTAQDRIDYLAEMCGLRRRDESSSPKVSWICATNREYSIDNIVRNYLRQRHPNMELIIVLNSDEFDKAKVENQLADVPHCRVLQLPESAYLGDCLNAGIEIMEGDYFFKIDDDDLYFENYTSDMLLPFKYTKARIVGKQSVFSYLEAEDALYQRFQGRVHRYSKLIAGPTLVADRRVLEKVPFGQFQVGTDTQWLRACLDAGERIYSTDPFNFVLIRRSDPEGHTWRASPEEVTKNAIKIGDGLAIKNVRV